MRIHSGRYSYNLLRRLRVVRSKRVGSSAVAANRRAAGSQDSSSPHKSFATGSIAASMAESPYAAATRQIVRRLIHFSVYTLTEGNANEQSFFFITSMILRLMRPRFFKNKG